MTLPVPNDLSTLPDEDLMLLVANGMIEQPATELFRRHNRTLFNFVAWLCHGNIAEAEDITQKTWIKLMSRCGDYRPESAFRTFLYQIARNAWLDIRRSAAETTREALDDSHLELPNEDLAPEVELHLKQRLHTVRQALLSLPVAQREVIVLRFFNDMSMEEIAQTVGEGFETVKSRLRYAFARLRRELESHA
ncbi:MAG TPA: sigma-70 family RNA polymerase sigma factor [Rhodocyclaceae bacterium]|nr:sigma-70 family RNA polymerase sigma factor [Rhodocyclaceae bacterium]